MPFKDFNIHNLNTYRRNTPEQIKEKMTMLKKPNFIKKEEPKQTQQPLINIKNKIDNQKEINRYTE